VLNVVLDIVAVVTTWTIDDESVPAGSRGRGSKVGAG
jgi:hypothetical protein